MKFELSIKELELIIEKMRGFSGVESMMLCSKITVEIEHRKKLESLTFEDEENCLSCHL